MDEYIKIHLRTIYFNIFTFIHVYTIKYLLATQINVGADILVNKGCYSSVICYCVGLLNDDSCPLCAWKLKYKTGIWSVFAPSVTSYDGWGDFGIAQPFHKNHT